MLDVGRFDPNILKIFIINWITQSQNILYNDIYVYSIRIIINTIAAWSFECLYVSLVTVSLCVNHVSISYTQNNMADTWPYGRHLPKIDKNLLIIGWIIHLTLRLTKLLMGKSGCVFWCWGRGLMLCDNCQSFCWHLLAALCSISKSFKT